MKAVLQRVTSAGVAIDGGPRQGIGPGLVVLFLSLIHISSFAISFSFWSAASNPCRNDSTNRRTSARFRS